MQVNLANTLSRPLRTLAAFVAHQEKGSGLSTSRFVQDTATSWAPKAVFARSKADFAENTFLEFTESALVYFVPAIIGEKVARRVFSRGLSAEAKKLVAIPAAELLKSKNPLSKQVMPIKAAIALTALFVPLCEFSLNYFKNLLTLKVFKKSDFNNIANLDKNAKGDENKDRVIKGARKNIIRAGVIFASSLLLAGVLAKKGPSSKLLGNISEFILAPGTKMFKNSPKKAGFFNKYFSPDFAQEAGKLTLSKGQLTSCVLVGGLGYFGAAKDRGKQNLQETAFRYPLVGLYVITGSELFEKGFKALLKKGGKCKELIGKNLEVPKFSELEGIAKNLAKKNATSLESEFGRLAKQKVLISGVPYLFGIAVMGFFVAGVSNFFTKLRYGSELKKTQYKQYEKTCLDGAFGNFFM